MAVSAKSLLTSGIAALGVSAIAIASVQAAPPDIAVRADKPACARVVSDEFVELMASVRSAAPADPSPAQVTAAPVPFNAASDAIINAWNAVLPWIDYGVELADYVLGFIPFGYLIADQVDMVYFSLVRPVANSFVVDLVAPVVNDPLNPASYVDGLWTLGSVTVNSLINLGINEFNYFFGWLIPPIPPLPPLPLAAEDPETEPTTAESVEEPAEAMLAAAAQTESIGETADGVGETVSSPTDGTDTESSDTDIAETEATDSSEIEDAQAVETETVASETGDTGTVDTEPTTSTSGTVAAQGDVRGSSADAAKQKTAEADAPSRGDKQPDGTQARTPASTDDDSAQPSGAGDADGDSGDNGDSGSSSEE